MTSSIDLTALFNPTVLFFFLGMLATLVRSDFEVPKAASKMVSYYLLMSIGLKGGQELVHAESAGQAWAVLRLALAAAIIVPFVMYPILKRRLGVANAAAIAATYGSVSAVTFVTAVDFLGQQGTPFGGHLVAAMAMMEAPAIVVALMLVKRNNAASEAQKSWSAALKEAFKSGSVLVVLGSLMIGMVAPARDMQALAPFTNDLFKGMLAFFLLDMGSVAARRIRDALSAGAVVIGVALFAPVVNGVLMAVAAAGLDVSVGDAYLLTILAASASYIAVPAAMRSALPEANAGVFLSMSLAITFPLNIVIGVPGYYALVSWMVG